MRTRRLAPLLVAACLAVPLAPLSVSPRRLPRRRPPRSSAPSEAARRERGVEPRDLVSGGDALVDVRVPDGRRPRRRSASPWAARTSPTASACGATAGSRDCSRAWRSATNVVRARAPGYAGRTVITNHPNGGPVFSGPQLTPYQCQETRGRRAVQRAGRPTSCSTSPPTRPSPGCSPTTRTTRRPTSRRRPPTRASRCRSSSGRRRGSRTATATRSCSSGSRARSGRRGRRRSSGTTRCVITHGGGCGASYAPGNPPLEDYSGTIPRDARHRAELRRRARRAASRCCPPPSTTPGTTATWPCRPSRW